MTTNPDERRDVVELLRTSDQPLTAKQVAQKAFGSDSQKTSQRTAAVLGELAVAATTERRVSANPGGQGYELASVSCVGFTKPPVDYLKRRKLGISTRSEMRIRYAALVRSALGGTC